MVSIDYDEFWTLIEEENKIKSDINKELIKLNSLIFYKNKLVYHLNETNQLDLGYIDFEATVNIF